MIFFTQAKFLENKIYTEKRVNYDKLHSKLPILRVNYDKLHSKLPIFCVKSLKIYTGQKKFTWAPPVAPVTNMRYGQGLQILKLAGLKVLLRVSDSVVLQGISTSIPQTVALLQLDAFQILLEVFLRGLPRSSYINVPLRHLGRHSSDR